MRSRIGVAIDAAELRAVLVESGVVRWHATTRLVAAQSANDALRDLFVGAPSAARRARTTVVLSREWVQAKPLPGFPAVKSARLASQLLRQNEQSFFLATGRTRTIVDLHVAADGTPWGAAFDTGVLDEISRGATSARLKLVRVAPLVVALSALDASGDARAPAALQPIGEDAASYLGAYAAAFAPRRLPLAWHPPSHRRHPRRWTIAGRAVAYAALSAAAAFAALAPAIRAARSSRDLERQLEELRPRQAEVQRTQLELTRVTDAMNRIAAFSAHRGEVTRLLATLSRVIPESTALLTVRIDSVDGAFTAIAPRVADVMPTLVTENGIVAPRIVGSMTREVTGGAQVERAAFRFRRRATPSRR